CDSLLWVVCVVATIDLDRPPIANTTILIDRVPEQGRARELRLGASSERACQREQRPQGDRVFADTRSLGRRCVTPCSSRCVFTVHLGTTRQATAGQCQQCE